MQFQIIDREDHSNFLKALTIFCKNNIQNHFHNKSNYSILFLKDLFIICDHNNYGQENFNAWKALGDHEEFTQGKCNLYSNAEKTHVAIRVVLNRNNFFYFKNKKTNQNLLKNCINPSIRIKLVDTFQKELLPEKKAIENLASKNFLNNLKEDYKNVLEGDLDSIRFFTNIKDWLDNNPFSNKGPFIENVKRISKTAKIFTALDKDINEIRSGIESLMFSSVPFIHSLTINKLVYLRKKHKKISDYLHNDIELTKNTLFLKNKLIDMNQLNLLLIQMENRWVIAKV